jgi:asparaginyl-tRNA synthetase
MFIKTADVKRFAGREVKLRGWVYRKRESKKTVFIVLRDASGTVQCVAKAGGKAFKEAQIVTVESSVELSGRVRKDSRAPTGFEIDIDSFRIVGLAETFPITKDQSTEFLLDVRHLWIRSRRLTNIFKVRSEVFGLIDQFFRENGFFEIQSPSLTGSACEGGSTMFEVKYFNQKAYLTQSWQLYAEAMIASLEKIYCIAPSFRAEKSRTRRHLAEYWHAEAEAAWMEHKGNLKLQNELINFVLKGVVKNRSEELELIGRDPKELKRMAGEFKVITYLDALKILEKDGMKMKWGDDFGVPQEKQLTEHFKKPFFVVEYPKGAKAFYMKENPKDTKTVLCDDLLAPEGYGEIIGGSERETDNKKLIQMIKATGGNPKDYEWYLDIRKYGSVPHSGFGLGVERLIMWICRLEHIRDAIAFPRVINRIYP